MAGVVTMDGSTLVMRNMLVLITANINFLKAIEIPLMGLKVFGGFAKHRLTQFNGISKENFNLYLKKAEFRFNHRGQDLYQIFLKLFRDHPL